MKPVTTAALLDWFDRSSGVTTDTRHCGPGKLFFALKGERFDGNAFAKDALNAGCLGAVVDDPSVQGDGILWVEDVLTALQDVAHLHREPFSGSGIRAHRKQWQDDHQRASSCGAVPSF